MPFDLRRASCSPEVGAAEIDRYKEEMNIRNLEHVIETAEYGGGVRHYWGMLADAQRRHYEAAQRVNEVYNAYSRQREGNR